MFFLVKSETTNPKRAESLRNFMEPAIAQDYLLRLNWNIKPTNKQVICSSPISCCQPKPRQSYDRPFASLDLGIYREI